MKALWISLALVAGCKSENPAPDLPDASRADAPVDVATVCLDPSGSPANCFQQDVCAPTEDVDFLNGCTDQQCIAFDNAARLPRFNNGSLPPLP